MVEKSKEKPIAEFRAGKIKAAVWCHIQRSDDKDIKTYSVSITKSYRDNEGKWHETNTFFSDDLPRLCLVANQAFEFMVLRREAPDNGE